MRKNSLKTVVSETFETKLHENMVHIHARIFYQTCFIIMMVNLNIFIVEYCTKLNVLYIVSKETTKIDFSSLEWTFDIWNALLDTTDNTTQMNSAYAIVFITIQVKHFKLHNIETLFTQVTYRPLSDMIIVLIMIILTYFWFDVTCFTIYQTQWFMFIIITIHNIVILSQKHDLFKQIWVHSTIKCNISDQDACQTSQRAQAINWMQTKYCYNEHIIKQYDVLSFMHSVKIYLSITSSKSKYTMI